VRIAAIVNGPRRALQVARAGRERVLEHFAMTRLLGDELEWIERAVGASEVSRTGRARSRRARVEAAA
jgi:hypothetical protein